MRIFIMTAYPRESGQFPDDLARNVKTYAFFLFICNKESVEAFGQASVKLGQRRNSALLTS